MGEKKESKKELISLEDDCTAEEVDETKLKWRKLIKKGYYHYVLNVKKKKDNTAWHCADDNNNLLDKLTLNNQSFLNLECGVEKLAKLFPIDVSLHTKG